MKDICKHCHRQKRRIDGCPQLGSESDSTDAPGPNLNIRVATIPTPQDFCTTCTALLWGSTIAKARAKLSPCVAHVCQKLTNDNLQWHTGVVQAEAWSGCKRVCGCNFLLSEQKRKIQTLALAKSPTRVEGLGSRVCTFKIAQQESRSKVSDSQPSCTEQLQP